MLFVFAALLALVAAQCDVEGMTYMFMDGDTMMSMTFGAAVDDWVPGLLNMGDVNSVYFTTWQQASDTRWTVMDFGSSSSESTSAYCGLTGQYTFDFYNGCSELHLTLLSDSCQERAGFLQNEFMMVVRPDDASCVDAGTELTLTVGESETWPRLSGDDATVIFGADQFALVSLGSVVIVQRWRESSGNHEVTIVDLGSYPAGYMCESTEKGVYLHTEDWGGDSCAVRFCGMTEQCTARSELLHNAAFNDFEGDECTNDVSFPEDFRPTSCSNGAQWNKHAEDCINQDVEGGCAFCSGVAMGVTSNWCLNREGAGCHDIFESNARMTFCNVEFECPASTASVSLVVFISALIALFFH